MFADACSRVSGFTQPLLISTKLQSGEVRTDTGTFIVLNRDGWVLTAGHAFDSYNRFQTDQKKIKEINELNASRQQRPGAPSSEVKLDPNYVVRHSFWWGWDGVRMVKATINRQIDIAVCKLEGFDPSWVREYPVLKDPSSIRPGTTVCRSGYAFINIKSKYDEKLQAFSIPRLPKEELIFSNDGMHARTVSNGRTKDGKYELRYIQTTTPGLKGQSGGPIFDRQGHIYAMQVKTMHVPLGFHPSVEYDGEFMVENQFMNLGTGIHIGTVRAFLDDMGIKYVSEGEESGFHIIG